jgi:hypothetical protein
MSKVGRYAVLFKAFSTDAFVLRRLARVVAAAPSADVYLMLDETSGSFGPVAFDNVIRYRESDVLALGFAPHANGSLFWYNADYPLYYFQHLHPDYDMILMIEYDAVPNIDLDGLVQACRDAGIDFLGQPIAKTLEEYWWTESMLRFYRPDQVRLYLTCVAVFSARAVRHLAECRRQQGRLYDLPDASQWPIGETFIGTELSVGGFSLHDLSDFGRLSRYDWWPPAHETELPNFADDIFVHPVLIGRRYLKSLFKSNFKSGLIAVVKFTIPGFLRTMLRIVLHKRLVPIRSGADARSPCHLAPPHGPGVSFPGP